MSDSTTPQDDKAMPPASAGSHGEHGQAMFSERSSMANAAERWCDQIGVSPVAFNVVTALFRLGLVQKPDPQPTITDEERERVGVVADWAAEHLGQDDPGVVALRAWLERVT